MISYVILIAISIGVSIGVFMWLKDMANVNPKIDCKDGTSLRINDITCSADTITVYLKNNGNFNVNGFMILASDDVNRIPTRKLGATGDAAWKQDGYYDFSPVLKPGSEEAIQFDKDEFIEIIQIQPYIRDDKGRIIVCEKAVMKQDTSGCGILPIDPLSIEGIVSWWGFNGDADDKNNNNAGTCANCPTNTTDRYGTTNGAYLFDGVDDYVQATVTQDKNTTIFWYKNSTASSWTFVANASGTLYVNGNLGTPNEYPVYINGDEVYIGRKDASTFFNGSIDDVMIFNKSLLISDIQSLYESPYTIPEPPAGPSCGDANCDAGEDFITCSADCGIETIPSLVSWWKFEDNADDSKDGNDGNVNEAIWTTGKSGKALQFDGINDYVDVTDNFNLNPADAITLSVWIKRENTDNAPRAVIKKSTSATNGYVLELDPLSSDKLKFYLYLGSNWYNVSTSSLQASQWYHVVGAYDGTDMKIYVNGILNSTAAVSGNIVNANGILAIGTDPANLGQSARYWNGSIDDVIISNQALDANTIHNIYCNTGGISGCP